jgi:hypothetical protein
MRRAGRGGVHELSDGIHDPAPDRYAVVIAAGREFVDAGAWPLTRHLRSM